LSFKAAIREVDLVNPFSVKIKNLIISRILDFKHFYANMVLVDLQ
jgi:hypothetical protein